MNRKGFTLFLSAILMITTVAAIVSASGWQQFQTDEVNAGIAADSAPVAAPDDMTIGDVQPALQGAAVPDEGTELENDGGNFLVLSDWTRYDFDVGAGTDKWAYEGEVRGTPATANDPDGVIDSYSNIRADDGTYETYVTSTNGKYAAQRFNFSIDDNEESWITKINVTWNGKGWHDTGGLAYNGTYLYIWNGTGYEELANNIVSTDATLTGEVTSDISNYINAGNVTILVKQKSTQTSEPDRYSHIETDYVKVVVTP